MSRKRAQAGFTLLEVMAAFVIAALATVVVLRAGFTGAAQTGIAAQYQQAVSRADSRLASLGVLTRLQPEHLSGDDGGGFSWRLDIVALQTSGPLCLYGISLSELFGHRAVRLVTQRIGPAK